MWEFFYKINYNNFKYEKRSNFFVHYKNFIIKSNAFKLDVCGAFFWI